MPSSTPLYNVKLQSSLNLNNQLLLNSDSAKKYTLEYVGAANKTLDFSDIGSLLIFSGNRTLTIDSASIGGITAGDSFTMTSSGTITVSATGGISILDSVDNSTTYNITQLVYSGSNVWIKINTN